MKHHIVSYIGIALITLGANSVPAQILFEDSFESNDLEKIENGFKWSSPVYTTPTEAIARLGGRSLQFTYKATDENADSWAEQRFDLGGYYKDVWVSYDILIPDNYYHRSVPGSTNNKGFLMLWSDDYSKPTGPKIGPEFWPNPDGSSKASIRLSGVGFDKHFWSACPTAIELSDRGQWIKVVAHYKYATSANNDGVAQIWKIYRDGKRKLTCDITDGAWYYPSAPGFNKGYILGWSNTGFKETTIFYVDNFKVSKDSLLDLDDNAPKGPEGVRIFSK